MKKKQPAVAPLAKQYSSYGTVLEAAFVDPAYTWPPKEGEGKNAIELQASANLLEDAESVCTTESEKEKMKIPPRPRVMGGSKKKNSFKCCSGSDKQMLALHEWELKKSEALEARKAHYEQKMERAKAQRKLNRYNRVPEGILIYRLDTATQTLTLMSHPHAATDMDALVEEMVIASARPAAGNSRRGMFLKGVDGRSTTLVACEQRTAIAWMEAIDLMLANRRRQGHNVGALFVYCNISGTKLNSHISSLL